jgi:hypothetical protein
VRGLVPVADAAEGLLLDGLVLSGVALLEDLFHRSLFTNKDTRRHNKNGNNTINKARHYVKCDSDTLLRPHH